MSINVPTPSPEQREKQARIRQMPLDDAVAYLTRADEPPSQIDIENELVRREIEGARDLMVSMRAAKRSADRSSTVLIALTVAIAFLTAALVALTVVVVQRTP